MAIPGNRLTVVDEVNNGDRIPAWTANEADWRGVPASTLRAYVIDGLELDDKVTNYVSPASGSTGSYTLTGNKSWWLIITPTGTVNTLSIIFPSYTTLSDKQELLVNTTQAITTLGYNMGGAGNIAGPNTLAAGGFFRLRYDATLNTWYRVG